MTQLAIIHGKQKKQPAKRQGCVARVEVGHNLECLAEVRSILGPS